MPAIVCDDPPVILLPYFAEASRAMVFWNSTARASVQRCWTVPLHGQKFPTVRTASAGTNDRPHHRRPVRGSFAAPILSTGKPATYQLRTTRPCRGRSAP